MARKDNYLIQAQQAKRHFLSYDQQALIQKLKLESDDHYLYVKLLCQLYRIDRKTADMERLVDHTWVDGNSYEEVMTLLDLVCDSREGRYLSCRWKNMQSFGLQFHQNLLEEQKNPAAERFNRNPEGFSRACAALGGTPLPNADVAYAIELFDGLCIGIQLWLGDEEFAPRLRYLWDENANLYLKYETMYFAVNLLLRRILEQMGR